MAGASSETLGLRPLEIPPPALDKNVSLHTAILHRRTLREIAPTPLDRQQLSNLLWAACGVNREKGPFGEPGLTAASASNSQEIDLYVLLAEGGYRYDAIAHQLVAVAAGDVRSAAMNRRQGLGSLAPLQIVFVVDLEKLTHTAGFDEPGLHDAEVQKSYYFVDTGIIAGHIYLFAAATGLASWFHNCDKEAVTAALSLKATQRVLFAQSVGWPAAEGAS